MLYALDTLLTWLTNPKNNNDNNCREIDYFVAYDIVGTPQYEKLPADIQEIIFDIGSSLSDTFTAPKVANNFLSTPEQLLNRIRKLIELKINIKK